MDVSNIKLGTLHITEPIQDLDLSDFVAVLPDTIHQTSDPVAFVIGNLDEVAQTNFVTVADSGSKVLEGGLGCSNDVPVVNQTNHSLLHCGDQVVHPAFRI